MNFKKLWKRSVSVAVMLCMVLTSVPVYVSAAAPQNASFSIGANGEAILNWSADPGAIGYRIYDRDPDYNAYEDAIITINNGNTVTADISAYTSTWEPDRLYPIYIQSINSLGTSSDSDDVRVFGYKGYTSDSGYRSMSFGAGFVVAVTAKTGKVVCWGDNREGQCNFPTGLSGVVSVSSGISHTAALKTDGTVVIWGKELAAGTAGSSPLLTSPVGAIKAVKIDSGSYHSLALKEDGSISGWGAGTAVSSCTSTTTTVWSCGQAASVAPAGVSFSDIAAGDRHSAAVDSVTGEVWSWGRNDNQAFGINATTSNTGTITAQRVRTTSTSFLTGVKTIAAGTSFTTALKSSGEVWQWGKNTEGQAGASTPTTGVTYATLRTSSVKSIQSGSEHVVALKTDGAVWAWGRNHVGQLGNGATTSIKTPTVITAIPNSSSVYASSIYTVAVPSDGSDIKIYGNNTFLEKIVPKPLTKIKSITSGNGFSVFLDSDNKVSSTGDTYGISNKDALPAGISSGRYKYISSSPTHTIAVKSSSTEDQVVGWGSPDAILNPDISLGTNSSRAMVGHVNSSYSILKDGSVSAWDSLETINPAIATRAGLDAAFPGANVVKIAGSYALLDNGRAVCLLEDLNDDCVPLTDPIVNSNIIMADIALGSNFGGGAEHYLVLTSEGEVYGLGFNDNGQATGQSGADVTTLTPVKISGVNITGIRAIAAGTGYSLALKSNGTVLGWGKNNLKQASGNSASTSVTPTNVNVAGFGQIVDAVAISAGISHAYALRSDGSVIGWGSNTYNQINPEYFGGQPSTAYAPSAVSVTTDNSKPKTLSVSWNDPNGAPTPSSYDVYLNGVKKTSTANKQTDLTNVSYGKVYTVVIESKTALGVTSAASIPVNVHYTDIVAPTKPENTRAYYHGDPTVNGGDSTVEVRYAWDASTDNDTVTYQVYEDGVLVGTTGNTTWTKLYTDSTSLSDPTHTFRVVAIDPAGNSTSGDTHTVYTFDNTNPSTPNGLALDTKTSTTIKVNWSASSDNKAVSGYNVYKNGVFHAFTKLATFNFTGLTPETDYTIKVEALDMSGNNSGMSNQITVKTLSTLDNTKPTVPTGLSSPEQTSTSVTLNWIASQDDFGVTKYNIYKNGLLTASTTDNTTNIVVNGLSPGTSYAFRVEAEDAAGNKSDFSSVLSVSTPEIIDNEPPTVPTDVSVSSITQSGFTVSWTHSTDNNSILGYEVKATRNDGSGLAVVTNVNYINTVTLNNLPQNTSYKVSVRSKDIVSNWSDYSSPEVDAVLVEVEDSTAPSTPAQITFENVGAGGFKATWSASTDNIGVAGYKVSINGVVLGYTNDTFYNVTGLNAETAYQITVVAYDGKSNESSPVTNGVMTTADTTAPTVPSSFALDGVMSTSIKLRWVASTDDTSTIRYKVFHFNHEPAGSVLNSTNYEVTGLLPDTTYSFYIKACDLSENCSEATNIVAAQTVSDIPTPAKPINLKLEEKVTKYTRISWESGTSGDSLVSDKYFIYLNGSNTPIAETTNTQYDIVDMVPNQVNTVEISAYNTAASIGSPKSDSLSYTPTVDAVVPGIPNRIAVTNVGASTLGLAWDPAPDNGVIKEYIFYMAAYGSKPALFKTINAKSVCSTVRCEYTVTGLKPGRKYVSYMISKDLFGNESGKSAEINIKTEKDTEAPSVPALISLPVTIDTVGPQFALLDWSDSSDNVAVGRYLVYNNGVQVITENPIRKSQFVVTGLVPNTTYSFTVRAVDTSGQMSDISSPISITTGIDNVAPLSPVSLAASYIDKTSFKLSWSPRTAANDDGNGRMFLVYDSKSTETETDDVLLVTTSRSSTMINGLEPKTRYDLYVKSRDLAGNVSTASAILDVTTITDITPPSKPSNVKIIGRDSSSLSLDWSNSTDDTGISKYTIKLYSGLKVEGTPLGSFDSITSDYILEDSSYNFDTTAYTIRINSEDLVGNKSSGSVITTLIKPAGHSVPTVPTLSEGSVTATSAVVSIGGSTASANLFYDIYLDGVFVGSATTNSYTLNKLDPNKQYTITAKASDQYGFKSSQSAALQVTTSPDTTNPVDSLATGFKSTITRDTSLVLEWLPASDNHKIKEYEVYLGDSLIPQITEEPALNVDGLKPSTKYSFKVVAVDASNNKSAGIVKTLATAGDKTAPSVPDNVVATDVGQRSFKVTWNHSEDLTGVHKYEIYSGEDKRARINRIDGTQNYYVLSNLPLFTTYNISIVAVDVYGNKSAYSELVTVTTLADNDSPTVPAGIKYSAAGPNKVNFTWKASTDANKVLGYEIYDNGLLIGYSIKPNFQLNRISTGSEYSITIKAVDSSGNKSEAAGPISINLANDSAVPTAPQYLAINSVFPTALTLSWYTAEDSGGLMGYEIYVNNQQHAVVSRSAVAYRITGLTSSTEYSIKMRAVDIAGNKSEFSPILKVTTAIEGSKGDLIKPVVLKKNYTNRVIGIDLSISGPAILNASLYRYSDNSLISEPMKSVTVEKASKRRITLDLLSQPDGLYYLVVQGSYGLDKRGQTIQIIEKDTSGPTVFNVDTSDKVGTTTKIKFDASEYGLASVTIYDIAGKVVRKLGDKIVVPKGNNVVEWDGKNSSGALVTTGTYTVKIQMVDKMKLKSTIQSQTIEM